MDMNVLREAATVVSFLTFLGILLWTVHPAQRARFEEAANAPLEDEDDLTLSPTLSQGRGSERGTGFRVREH